MRTRNLSTSLSAILIFAVSVGGAKHGHEHLDTLFKRHQPNHAHRPQYRSVPEAGQRGLAVRSLKQGRSSGKCTFPNDAGLVAVTPDDENAGWAMSPNQPCVPDSYCPYACPPGQVSMQWDPSATEYSYPKSMNGGLYCDGNGEISKPFPNKPYCQDAKAGIGASNKAGGVVAFCQTVLPGNEAMLIPTDVQDSAELAVPGTDYWAGTAAHYYINPPGIGCDEACVWGTKDNPVGNWSPYVAGANMDKNGEVFIKLGWNPIYLEPETPFKDEMPSWGVEIDCDGDGCNGLPCSIDPSVNKVNEMVGGATTGAGGASFCVVTVPKGANATFVITGGAGGSNEKPSYEPKPKSGNTKDSVLDAMPGGYAAKAHVDTSAGDGSHEFYEVSNRTNLDAPSSDAEAPIATSTGELEEFAGAASTTQSRWMSLAMSSLMAFLTVSL